MRGFAAVFSRELKGYFTTPVAYVFLVVFLFFAGYLPFEVGGFFAARQANLDVFFRYIPMLMLLLVPGVSMRLWAEERRSGSIEQLLTLPITVLQAVLGKFLAAWAFLALALALTAPMPVTVEYLGDPDWGAILAGYLASWLLAGALLAVGCFFSALSKNQVISFILTVVACSVLVFAGRPSTIAYLSGKLPAGLVEAVETFSMQNHFDWMTRGVLSLGALAYFLILIAGWLGASAILLNERRAA